MSGREISLRAWVRVAEDPVDDEKARNDEPVRFSVTDFSEDAWLCVLDPHATSRRVYCAPMDGAVRRSACSRATALACQPGSSILGGARRERLGQLCGTESPRSSLTTILSEFAAEAPALRSRLA